MRFLALDDEITSLRNLEECIRLACQESEDGTVIVDSYDDPSKALDAATAGSYDAIFLDINMGGSRKGIEIARGIKDHDPAVNIIFCTGYSEFTGDAMALHASGYIMKPVTPEKIGKELSDLRYKDKPTGNSVPVRAVPSGTEDMSPAKDDNSGSGRLRVQTFGNFEVFYNDVPLVFAYNKTREMLAYLIDRKGAMVSNAELVEVLWEESESPKESYLRNIRLDLTRSLKKIGQSSVLVRRKGLNGINPELIDCDYYDLLADIKANGGKPSSAGGYFGEYMNQYPWGNYTNNFLRNRLGL